LFATIALAFAVLRYFSFNVEDLQVAFFPFIVFCFWGLLRHINYRWVSCSAIALIVFWFIGMGSTRALYPFGYSSPGAYIARLSNDSLNGGAAREFQQGFNTVANRNGLKQAQLLQRSFESSKSAQDWLRGKSNLNLLITGTTSGKEVLLPFHIWEQSSIPDTVSKRYADVLDSLKLSEVDHLRPVVIDNKEEYLFLVDGVSRIRFSASSTSAAYSYLPWLAEGFDTRDLQLQQRAFGSASQVLGPWGSGEALAVSNLYFGVAQLLDASANGFSGKQPLRCIKKTLSRAQRFVGRSKLPELAAAIMNNLAIEKFFLGSRERKFDTVEQLLTHATMYVDTDGNPVPGAKAAMANLILLGRMGAY